MNSTFRCQLSGCGPSGCGWLEAHLFTDCEREVVNLMQMNQYSCSITLVLTHRPAMATKTEGQHSIWVCKTAHAYRKQTKHRNQVSLMSCDINWGYHWHWCAGLSSLLESHQISRPWPWEWTNWVLDLYQIDTIYKVKSKKFRSSDAQTLVNHMWGLVVMSVVRRLD
jgi:hypothetical protein